MFATHCQDFANSPYDALYKSLNELIDNSVLREDYESQVFSMLEDDTYHNFDYAIQNFYKIGFLLIESLYETNWPR